MKWCKQNTASVYIQAHAHFGQSSNNVFKVFICLLIAIKIAVHHIV